MTMSLLGVFKGSEKDISSMISLAENDPLKARKEMKLIAKRAGLLTLPVPTQEAQSSGTG
ncbi:MAG: hypothetical protein HZB68_04680 [Candidatus Aenigmarchaeota archaeon]|nr:hypothetical protein [Candidatus Aenigmarchaeota archaeon]